MDTNKLSALISWVASESIVSPRSYYDYICGQVMVSPGLDNIQQSTFSYNFDYERRVEAEATAAATRGSASGNPYQNVSSDQVTASIQVYIPQLLHPVDNSFANVCVCQPLVE